MRKYHRLEPDFLDNPLLFENPLSRNQKIAIGVGVGFGIVGAVSVFLVLRHRAQQAVGPGPESSGRRALAPPIPIGYHWVQLPSLKETLFGGEWRVPPNTRFRAYYWTLSPEDETLHFDGYAPAPNTRIVWWTVSRTRPFDWPTDPPLIFGGQCPEDLNLPPPAWVEGETGPGEGFETFTEPCAMWTLQPI